MAAKSKSTLTILDHLQKNMPKDMKIEEEEKELEDDEDEEQPMLSRPQPAKKIYR